MHDPTLTSRISLNRKVPTGENFLPVLLYALSFFPVGLDELVEDFVEGDSGEPSGTLLTCAYHSFALQALQTTVELPLVRFQSFRYVSGFLRVMLRQVNVNLGI